MGEEERRAVLEVIESDVLSAFIGGAGPFFLGGPHVRAFEQAWADKYGFSHAVSVNSWTSGLMTAIGAVGIEPGDEVICSPYTMSASATCALFYGGIPVFADIDPITFCLDPASIESRVTPRTKAIVVVHLFGHPADMDPIMEVARRHDLRVIEDAAQAPGVYYKGRPVGAIGDVGGFSLNFHKHIHTGEGGMIVTNNPAIARRCQLIRNHGENAVDSTTEDIANTIGGNYRLTELQAAVGVRQLERLGSCLATRTTLSARLKQRLSGIPGLSTQPDQPGSTHACYVFPIRFDADSVGLSRNQFVKAVLSELPKPEGIESTALTEGYVRPLYLSRIYQEHRAIGTKGFPFTTNPGIQYDYSKGLCPVCERMYERELVLSPLVREPLTPADMDDLANAMEKVAQNAPRIRAALGDSDGGILTPLAMANQTSAR